MPGAPHPRFFAIEKHAVEKECRPSKPIFTISRKKSGEKADISR